MYGYIRPDKGELKVREYESFRGVYCGLCHTLKARYGWACRFLVNYDFTFLAMLLAPAGEAVTCVRRCPYHPFRKTRCPSACPSLETAADHSVILGYWKLKDGMTDRGFLGRLGCALACLILRRAYHKAVQKQPAFAKATEENLKALGALERESCASLDQVADRFARILQAVAQDGDSPRDRVLRQLLYPLGRIVYVLDAVDDLAEDEKSGGYNPLRYRYTLEGGKLRDEDAAALRQSLQLSHNSLSAAFQLLEENPYTGILSNVIYFGLPSVTQAVFAGTWQAERPIHKKRSDL
jgi:hypothetical protein